MDTGVNPAIELHINKFHFLFFAFIDHGIFAFNIEANSYRHLFEDFFQRRKWAVNRRSSLISLVFVELVAASILHAFIGIIGNQGECQTF